MHPEMEGILYVRTARERGGGDTMGNRRMLAEHICGQRDRKMFCLQLICYECWGRVIAAG